MLGDEEALRTAAKQHPVPAGVKDDTVVDHTIHPGQPHLPTGRCGKSPPQRDAGDLGLQKVGDVEFEVIGLLGIRLCLQILEQLLPPHAVMVARLWSAGTRVGGAARDVHSPRARG